MRTVVVVSDAEPQTEGRLYRVYETPGQLTLLLTLANDSSQNLFVDQTGLERDVRFTVTRDRRRVPISARWNRDPRQVGLDAPAAVLRGSSVRIALGDAYLRVKRYAEAIVEFENAWRVMPRHHSGVPYQLAFAYLEQPTEEWIAARQTEHGRDTANCQ